MRLLFKIQRSDPPNMPTWSNSCQRSIIIPYVALCFTCTGSSAHLHFPFFFLTRLADGVTFHSQDSRMPRGESDDGTQPRCYLWTYVSPCLCVIYFMAYATAATLMRSRNPAAEFSDMAGKALTIEWLVENAPTIFPPMSTSI